MSGQRAARAMDAGLAANRPPAANFGVGTWFSTDTKWFSFSNGTTWVDAAAPWYVPIRATSSPAAVVGTWANGVSTSYIDNYYVINNTQAINDSITFPAVLLGAGTWTCDLFCATFSDEGIVTVQFNGVSQGTIDLYSAGLVATRETLSGLNVAATGLVTVSLVMAAKNASSTAYTIRVSDIILSRTA